MARPGALSFVLLALAAAIPVLQKRVDARVGSFRAQEEVLYLWTGPQVKRLAAGFEGVAADLYWLRTVQYFGGEHVYGTSRRFELLEPLIDITVTLDPRMEIAYRYGSIYLAEPVPVGAGRPRSAVALLERGVQANPDNWRLRKELGYFYFLFLNEPGKGAQVLLEASQLPGAAYWLRTMAADMLSKGGDRDMAEAIWRQMYEDAEPGAIKENALIHLRLLQVKDMRAMLQARIDEFTRKVGRPPASLQELMQRGFLRSVPDDPSGTAFDYDAKEGKVAVSTKSLLWRQEP